MTPWKWSIRVNLWHERNNWRDENSFWAFVKRKKVFWTTTNLEYISEWKENRWLGMNFSAMQNKLQNSRVFNGDLFFRMLAASRLFWQNRIKSHDVWGSMTSSALFRREWKRSTYNKNKICLDYLSHAIYIQRKWEFSCVLCLRASIAKVRNRIDERQVAVEMNLHKDSLEIYGEDCSSQ